MSIKVLILGGGPSAAFAHRACLDNGITPTVICADFKSYPRGAFWFYWLPDNKIYEQYATEIKISSVGTKEIYSLKQWGDKKYETSFPTEEKVIQAVIPSESVMNYLWQGCEPIIKTVTEDETRDIFPRDYDLIIRAFPSWGSLQALKDLDLLRYIRITTKWSDIAVDMPRCIYNGLPHENDVRITCLDGHTWWLEHSEDSTRIYEKFIPDLHPNVRPKSEWDVWNGKTLLVGRLATLDRKELSHQAYGRTQWALQNLG